jgi:hypothetical protein
MASPVERCDLSRCVMSLATPARPDLEAFAEATRAEQPELIRGLRDLLGARLVAYLAGVKRPARFDNGLTVSVASGTLRLSNACG